MSEVKLTIYPTSSMYYNKDSSYGVFRFKTYDGIESKALSRVPLFLNEEVEYEGVLVGNMPDLLIDNKYTIIAKEVLNRKYNNYQFELIKIEQQIPKSEYEKKQFLKFLLTEKQATTLLDAYPDIIERIIENKKVDLNKTKGIKEKTFEIIKDKVLENYVMMDMLNYLSPYNITYNKIVKIVKKFESPLIAKQAIQDNFYILTGIDGFGFKTADKIALKLNANLEISEERTLAFVEWTLKELSSGEGHTWVSHDKLIGLARSTVPKCVNIIKSILKNENDKYSNIFYIDNDKIGLVKFYRNESKIIEELDRVNESENIFTDIDSDKVKQYIKIIEDKQGFQFTKEQNKAILSILDNNVVIISGNAGSGKTSVINGIVQVIEKFYQYPKIGQCALSAKASQRMYEVTGRNSKTIHRLLAYGKDGFEFNESQLLPYDVVIADEFSMNNIHISLSLFKAIRNNSKLILVFDYAQLPPIGAGAIAHDLLEYSNYTKFKFSKVHRQAQDSGILSDANKIRVQENPIIKLEPKISHGVKNDMQYRFFKDRDKMHKFAVKAYEGAIKKYGIDNVNIICPRKDVVKNSVYFFNEDLQSIVNDKSGYSITYGKKTYYIGDRVIHKKNDYKKNVFNGETGTIEKIYGKTMIVNYGYDIYEMMEKGNKVYKYVEYQKEELGTIDLSYASSIHSFQGSQIDIAIIVLDNTHHMLLDSTILYTAITRAAKQCLLIAEPNAFKKCIRTNHGNSRDTFLSFLLKKA